MDRLATAKALRGDSNVHYNCCQSVLLPFADVCSLSREQLMALGAHFAAGMRHGGTCGAVSGALMVLGLAGKDEATVQDFLRAFRAKNTHLDCASLLKKAAEEGQQRKPHCDGMVFEAVTLVEELLEKQ